MVHAESKCRKLKVGETPFLAKYAGWAKRHQPYKELLRLKEKHGTNRRKVFCRALCAGTRHFDTLTKEDLHQRYLVCRAKVNELRNKAHHLRTSFLWDRFKEAQTKGNKSKASRLKAMIQRERLQKMWRTLTFTVGKPTSGSVTKVETVNGAVTCTYTTKTDIEAALADEHKSRFTLASNAPTGSTPLHNFLGHLATIPLAQDILNGAGAHKETYDSNVKELFDELASIAMTLRRRCIPITLTDDDFTAYCSKAKESTSSSASDLHFGHYKAALLSPLLIRFHAMELQLALQTGVYLDRWAREMSVILEKEASVFLVNKLRAILLMEADFNMINKLINEVRMMSHTRSHSVIHQ